MDIRQTVNKLIKKYNTDDPFELAALLGIHVLYGDLGGLYGNYLKYKRSKFIIIDVNKTPEQLRPFVCAHELGHALCTPSANTQWLKTYTMSINAGKVEHTANKFAVCLLLNERYLSEFPDISLYDLAANKGVPGQFIKLLKEL